MVGHNKHLLARIVLVACVALLPAAQLTAQQPLVKNQPLPFPIVPLLAEYENASQYFMQWINEKAAYSMIEAFSTKEQPEVFQIALMESGTGRKVYYSNSEARVKSLRRTGKETHLVKIDYRQIQNIGQFPTYAFAFPDEHGRAIRWRFIPAAAASPQGAGVSPQQVSEPGLRFRYRERATAAGDGTAIQIGDQVFEAEPWPEISAPPYFVAFRGSYVEGMEFGSLFVGAENWRVTSAPAELVEGAQWVFTDENKNTRRLKITQRRGDSLVVGEVADQASPSATLNLELHALPGGFALLSMTLRNDVHVMSIKFDPELNLSPIVSGPRNTEVTYQVDVDKHEKISQGRVIIEREGSIMRLRWQPRSPDWAKSHVLQTIITVSADSYQIETQ
jgi:hypothetical protein